MGLNPRQLLALPESTRRQLARGTTPVTQQSSTTQAKSGPLVTQVAQNQCKELVDDLSTFYRAAACTAFIKEVQAEKRPKDEAGGRVRFFATKHEARIFILDSIRAERAHLNKVESAVLSGDTDTPTEEP